MQVTLQKILKSVGVVVDLEKTSRDDGTNSTRHNKQCDKIGFLATKFVIKVAQIISSFLGLFWKTHSYVKTAVATFVNIWDIFYSNIGHTDYKRWSLVNLVIEGLTLAIFLTWDRVWAAVQNTNLKPGAHSIKLFLHYLRHWAVFFPVYAKFYGQNLNVISHLQFMDL